MGARINRLLRKTTRKHPLPFMQLPLNGNDYRGIPTMVCPCGCDMFIMLAKFDEDRLPGWFALDGVCAACGALVSLPCPADDEDGEW